MTAAFDEFMRQYKMTGTEKADGYSRESFIGLTESEKDEVFKLLIQELPFSASWLFFLDPKKAFKVVEDEEERARGDGYAHAYMLQSELIKYSGDLSYQNHMIEDYPTYTARLRPHVIDAIGKTPTSPAALDFFRQVVLTETDSLAVTSAVIALLDALRVPRATEGELAKYSQLKDGLRSEKIEGRLNALALLACYEKAVS